MNIPAVFLGQVLGIPVVEAWRVIILLLAAGSLALIGPIMTHLFSSSQLAKVRLSVFGLAVGLPVLPQHDFEQKEHLAVICALPLILLAGVRSAGRLVPWRLSGAVGVLGGIGFALKPAFCARGCRDRGGGSAPVSPPSSPDSSDRDSRRRPGRLSVPPSGQSSGRGLLELRPHVGP